METGTEQIKNCQLKKIYRKRRTDLNELLKILRRTGEITVFSDMCSVTDEKGNKITAYPAFVDNQETYISKSLLDFMLEKQFIIKAGG